MALSKTVTVTQQYQNNATSPSTVSFTAEAIVTEGQLIPDIRVTNPGIFTAGTAKEGTASNNVGL